MYNWILVPVRTRLYNGFWAEKAIKGLNGNGLVKTCVLSMEDKMATGAFRHARSYGWGGPCNAKNHKVHAPDFARRPFLRNAKKLKIIIMLYQGAWEDGHSVKSSISQEKTPTTVHCNFRNLLLAAKKSSNMTYLHILVIASIACSCIVAIIMCHCCCCCCCCLYCFCCGWSVCCCCCCWGCHCHCCSAQWQFLLMTFLLQRKEKEKWFPNNVMRVSVMQISISIILKRYFGRNTSR